MKTSPTVISHRRRHHRLEMGTVYDAFGSKVSVVEMTDGLIQGCDRDLVRPLQKRMEKRFEKIMLSTKVSSIEAKKDGIHVSFEGENAPEPQVYDRVLVAIGTPPERTQHRRREPRSSRRQAWFYRSG